MLRHQLETVQEQSNRPVIVVGLSLRNTTCRLSLRARQPVIASAAKQSPAFHAPARQAGDCFAALAMTGWRARSDRLYAI
jgi:hypothetical protein